MCKGDTTSLVEACKNLINNAANHGVPPITVFVDQSGNKAKLGARDQGPGIPEAMWEDAGSRFTKNAGVSSRSAGLGLAIVDAVAKAQGGAMKIARPSPDKFEVYIELSLLGGHDA